MDWDLTFQSTNLNSIYSQRLGPFYSNIIAVGFHYLLLDLCAWQSWKKLVVPTKYTNCISWLLRTKMVHWSWKHAQQFSFAVSFDLNCKYELSFLKGMLIFWRLYSKSHLGFTLDSLLFLTINPLQFHFQDFGHDLG